MLRVTCIQMSQSFYLVRTLHIGQISTPHYNITSVDNKIIIIVLKLHSGGLKS